MVGDRIAYDNLLTFKNFKAQLDHHSKDYLLSPLNLAYPAKNLRKCDWPIICFDIDVLFLVGLASFASLDDCA